MITLLDTNIGAYHIIINSEEQLVELEGDIEMLCSVLFHVAENSEEKESV